MSEVKELTPEQVAELVSQTEKQLAEEGLAPIKKTIQKEMEEAGWVGDSFEDLSSTEHDIKESLDNAVETENLFSSDIPLNKSGLPPCLRAKLEDARRISKKDPRLGDK